MKWTYNRVFKLFVVGVLLAALHAKLSSPVRMISHAEDATVILEIVRQVPVGGTSLLSIPYNKRHYKRHLQKENRGALCTGYIADSYGHIVTAAHCVKSNDIVSITVYLHNERKAYLSKVIVIKPILDIALIQADLPRNIPYLTTRNEYEWPGTHTYAIGHPLGLMYSVSDGIVSGYAPGDSGATFMQDTAPVNPGNSGGPIIADDGQVAGVCSFMDLAPWGTPANGLSFAVPAPTINIVMKGYLNHP